LTCLSDTLPKGSPVLDASVVINILGTGAAADVLAGLGHPSFVEERTLREVLRHPLTDTDLPQALKDLQRRGNLKVVRMTDQEYETYLGLVSGSLGSRLGIGESAGGPADGWPLGRVCGQTADRVDCRAHVAFTSVASRRSERSRGHQRGTRRQ
jgi:hypothetical protein